LNLYNQKEQKIGHHFLVRSLRRV